MKKFTLIAAFAAAAMAANAQYTAETPYLEPIANDANNERFDVIYLNATAIEKLQGMGKTIQDLGPDDVHRHLYYWDNTVVNGEAANALPGVGWSETEMNFEGVMCLNINNNDWSGLGYATDNEGGVDLKHINDNTRFHMALKSIGNAPNSVALILFNFDNISKPAKIAVGDPFVDNGAVIPAVAPKLTEDWVAVDISFGDIKKLYPQFEVEPNAVANMSGNILSMLAGGGVGKNFCWDATYLYTPKSDSGVETVAADNTSILYTGTTVNASGANGITLYDLTGKTVKSTNSTVLGVEGLAAGVYVVKAGNATQKIVVR